MNKQLRLITTTILLFSFGSVIAQSKSGVDSTGLPGDNFSLQGALEMFKKATSPEEFEKLVNTESNNINNLDLNRDGEIDYVKVIDKSEGTAHAFILQVPISKTESQDVAVIELDKTGDESAIVQIIGDEDLYGEEVIVEPNSDEANNAFLYDNDKTVAGGPYAEENFSPARMVVNVWFWPCVRYVYVPIYKPWVSPWYWSYYPGWWRPWRPFAWQVFHPRVAVYHRPFVVVHTYRIAHARRIYRPVRVYSQSVRSRNAVVVTHYKTTRPARRPVLRNTNSSMRPAYRAGTKPVARPGKRPGRPAVRPSRSSTRPAVRPSAARPSSHKAGSRPKRRN